MKPVKVARSAALLVCVFVAGMAPAGAQTGSTAGTSRSFKRSQRVSAAPMKRGCASQC